MMVHGGAGTLSRADRDPRFAAALQEGIRAALELGRGILARGGSAIDTVEACAACLEDDALFNAGRGSALNEDGRVECDAGIMDGRVLAAGAVAAVRGIANPIRLARKLMDDGEHVLLAGDGALRFAQRCGILTRPDGYFVTGVRQQELQRARARGRSSGHPPGDPSPQGTIGAIARDRYGHLAAATSTGGTVNKRLGRVGDSPIVGAGFYADDATCAVSATGHGEDLLRGLIAGTIAAAIEFRGLDAAAAVEFGIRRLRARFAGQGGVICIDAHGRCAAGTTTPHLVHGWIEHGGDAVCAL
ncbi:asparaginase [Thioalkalivibrio paradoxus ARh 1]|uniref:Isoaspartyl peptidase n=1 Tax=Thioalkalivibrio paradoxus ARh 1 TaxID=713585 RepID=W0DHT7_9GAMM|nr:asparaginase [Thioalkalivibrio paradoxus ARh 1]